MLGYAKVRNRPARQLTQNPPALLDLRALSAGGQVTEKGVVHSMTADFEERTRMPPNGVVRASSRGNLACAPQEWGNDLCNSRQKMIGSPLARAHRLSKARAWHLCRRGAEGNLVLSDGDQLVRVFDAERSEIVEPEQFTGFQMGGHDENRRGYLLRLKERKNVGKSDADTIIEGQRNEARLARFCPADSQRGTRRAKRIDNGAAATTRCRWKSPTGMAVAWRQRSGFE